MAGAGELRVADLVVERAAERRPRRLGHAAGGRVGRVRVDVDRPLPAAEVVGRRRVELDEDGQQLRDLRRLRLFQLPRILAGANGLLLERAELLRRGREAAGVPAQALLHPLARRAPWWGRHLAVGADDQLVPGLRGRFDERLDAVPVRAACLQLVGDRDTRGPLRAASGGRRDREQRHERCQRAERKRPPLSRIHHSPLLLPGAPLRVGAYG